MKIRIASDLHNNWGIHQPPVVDVDVEILAGDVDQGHNVRNKLIQYFKSAYPSDRPILHVLGNHEYWGNTISTLPGKLYTIKDECPNYNLLQNNVYELGDVTFIGATLWTDFKADTNPYVAMIAVESGMYDYKKIRAPGYRKLKAIHTLAEFYQSWSYIRDQSLIARAKGNKVVVITHHAPCVQSISSQHQGDALNAGYVNDLADQIAYTNVCDLWIHGHVHDSFDYTIYNTRVICNPYGYHNAEVNPNYNPEFIVEI